MESDIGELKKGVLDHAREHDVKFIRLWFTDILSMLKSFAITVEELEAALEEGMGFDGSSIEGFARIDENDLVRKALGGRVFTAFIQNKKIEWDRYRTQVTEYELEKCLPIL